MNKGIPMQLSAIVTSTLDDFTVGGVEEWLSDLFALGLTDEDEILDGAQAHVGDLPSLLTYTRSTKPGSRPTLGDVRQWIETLYEAGLSSTTYIEDATDLAADLTPKSVEPIECGDCRTLDVLVNLHTH